jgi:hypothetical protein
VADLAALERSDRRRITDDGRQVADIRGSLATRERCLAEHAAVTSGVIGPARPAGQWCLA